MDFSTDGMGGEGRKRPWGKYPDGNSLWVVAAPRHWPRPWMNTGLHRIGVNPETRRDNLFYCPRFATPAGRCPACETGESARAQGMVDLADTLRPQAGGAFWLLEVAYNGQAFALKGTPPQRMEMKPSITRQIESAKAVGTFVISAHGWAVLQVGRTGTGKTGTRYTANVHGQHVIVVPDAAFGPLFGVPSIEASDLIGYPDFDDIEYLVRNQAWPKKGQKAQLPAGINTGSATGGYSTPSAQLPVQPAFAPMQFVPQAYAAPPATYMAQAPQAPAQPPQPQPQSQAYAAPQPQPQPQPQPTQQMQAPRCFGTHEHNPAEAMCRSCAFFSPCAGVVAQQRATAAAAAAPPAFQGQGTQGPPPAYAAQPPAAPAPQPPAPSAQQPAPQAPPGFQYGAQPTGYPTIPGQMPVSGHPPQQAPAPAPQAPAQPAASGPVDPNDPMAKLAQLRQFVASKS